MLDLFFNKKFIFQVMANTVDFGPRAYIFSPLLESILKVSHNRQRIDFFTLAYAVQLELVVHIQ